MCDIMDSQTEIEFNLFKFIYDRQLVWYNRFVLQDKPPWTDDPILQKYKIINMYRELDKCTVYLLRALSEIRSREKLLLNIVFFRFFNRINLYEELNLTPFQELDSDTFNKIFCMFQERERKKKVIFNNAYLICSGIPKQKKYFSVLQAIKKLSENIEQLIKDMDSSRTPEESLKVLQRIGMVGPFLACEIWTDLTYFNFFNQNWTDNDFVNIGPGSKWGLEILAGRKLGRKEQEDYLSYLTKKQRQVLPTIHEKLNKPLSWNTISYKKAFTTCPYLSKTNIEGALCEFRKYWNLKHGKGRRKYFKKNKYFDTIKWQMN
jgi:hypothetical protein